jgi:DNA polymerase-1
MGTTEHGLTDSFHQDGQTNQTVEMSKRALDEWHRQYPGASAYIDGKHAQARRHGYVTNWLGRMRYLEGVQSSDKFARREAERQAQATPIQGGARDVVKMWIREIWPRLRDLQKRHYCEAVLDIHDSVLFEHDIAAKEPLRAIVMDALAAIQQFSVPITAKGTSGYRWSDL